MVKTVITNDTPSTVNQYVNGKIDAKGRVIGLFVKFWERDFSEIPEDTNCGFYRLEPGRYYVVRVQTTKDGNSWGATQGTKHFKTQSERADYILKRIKGFTLVDA